MSISKRHHKSRRQSSEKHGSESRKALRKIAQQHRLGLEGLQAAQFQLIGVFGRIRKLHDSLDKAFEEPFLEEMVPNAPANTHRFNACVDGYARLANLLGQVLELWMLACGLKQKDNWVPLLIEEMRQKAASKRVVSTRQKG
jgi:hypothetical protein